MSLCPLSTGFALAGAAASLAGLAGGFICAGGFTAVAAAGFGVVDCAEAGAATLLATSFP